ncbi:hypothetical protein AAMO2058_001241700 [Amorphochlora amoebiformis]
MDPLAEFEAEMQAQFESEATAGLEPTIEDQILSMHQNDPLDEDMKALAEAEATEPLDARRAPWDRNASKRRLTLNQSVVEEDRCKEDDISRKSNKKVAGKKRRILLPDLPRQHKRKENRDPADKLENSRSLLDDPLQLPNSDFSEDEEGGGLEIPALRGKTRDFEDNRCYATIPMTGDYISLTLEGGDRYYLKVESDREAEKEQQRLFEDIHNRTSEQSICRTSVKELLKQLDKEERIRYRREQKKRKKAEERLLRNRREGKSNGEIKPKSRVAQELWVDKYRPKKFIDLLGDDDINRKVLQWVKSWDEVVFPDKFKKNKKETDGFKTIMNSPQRRGKKRHETDRRGKREDNKVGESKYPEHKLILISGPAGLGKTTLAHVVAAHAGYRVVEINASDDRSKSKLMNKVLAATQMKSVFGSDTRPNCLVIDEIDGACGGSDAAGTIQALVKLANAPPPSTSSALDTENSSEDSKKTRKKSAPYLSRPVICVCNDPYTPALRPLRKLALNFTFTRPKTYSKLVNRLRYICRKERLKSDQSALHLLCKSLNGDVRSCLNMLQFVKTKCGSLTVDAIGSTSLGEKDISRDRFDVWKSIFRKKPYSQPSANSKRLQGSRRSRSEISTLNPMTHQLVGLSGWLTGHGDMDKVIEGVHFNYLNQPYMDIDLEHTSEVAEWFADADIMSTSARQTHGFSGAGPGRYAAFCPVAGWCSPYDSKAKRRHNAKLPMFSLEMLSPILDIVLRPRPAMEAGRRPTEAQKLEYVNLVDTYIGLGLTFTATAGLERGREKSSNQQFRYSTVQKLEMEPPICMLSEFGKTFSDIFNPRSKYGPQKVSTDLEVGTRYMSHKFKEKIRRDVEFESVRRNSAKESKKSPAKGSGLPQSSTPGGRTIEAFSQRLSKPKPKRLKMSNTSGKEKKNFLSQARSRSKKNRKPKAPSIISYTFQAGFTNAVRRPVVVRDFLAS